MMHLTVRKPNFLLFSLLSIALLLFPCTLPVSAKSENIIPKTAQPAYFSSLHITDPYLSESTQTEAENSSSDSGNVAGDNSSSDSGDTSNSNHSSNDASSDNQDNQDSQENTDSGFSVNVPCAIVIEASTGTILYEKDADIQRAPASVTKVMTLLLIFDALENGQIKLDDTVTVSEHAASMGGSQVFLETGETQTVETMIKCIAVASGNDSAVAMAEYVAGSEDAFVVKMNERATDLGMRNTHFVNCCGLDDDNHYTSARDIALMSRELTTKYPEIFDYTTIWMENITHVTMRGSSEFGLTNTNKLIRQYEGATGLKTGSTSKAGFCLSATATRNDISLIAVVMGCESSKERISVSSSLLDYGFSVCHIYTDDDPPELPPVAIRAGKQDQLSCRYGETFSYVSTTEFDNSGIERELAINENLTAPVSMGDEVGVLSYYNNGEKIGEVPVLADELIERANYIDYLNKLVSIL